MALAVVNDSSIRVQTGLGGDNSELSSTGIGGCCFSSTAKFLTPVCDGCDDCKQAWQDLFDSDCKDWMDET